MTQPPFLGAVPADTPIGWSHFLANIPPQTKVWVNNNALQADKKLAAMTDPGLKFRNTPSPFYLREPVAPGLSLYCAACSGKMNFSGKKTSCNDPSSFFDFNLEYICNNCKKYIKTYAIRVTYSEGKYFAQKFGEIPQFGEPVPNQFLRVIEKEKDNFLKGKGCEEHALGIGAFAYYRRIVENSWKEIIDKTIKAIEILSPPDKLDIIKQLNDLASENQFSKAVKEFKLPPSLMMNGYNPLLILHKNLSEGIHADSDERCLARATDIRTVLVEMTTRIDSIKKEDHALITAINNLANPKTL